MGYHCNLTELVERFVLDVCAGKRNTTPGAYRGKLLELVNFLGESEVNQESIDRFKAWLVNRKTKRRGARVINEPLSPFTIRSVLATTRHFLRWGAGKGYWLPVELANIPEPRPQPKAIEANTFEALVQVALKCHAIWEQIRNVAILFTLRDSGCRRGAVASIDVDDVDLDRGVIESMDKGGQMNWIYITAPTAEAIRSWIKVRSTLEPKDFKLWTGQKHHGLTALGIYRVICKLKELAGLHGVRCNPHSFRHAFARDALLAGADLSQVSQLLNHKSIVVTAKYYARWADKELKEIHKRVSPMVHRETKRPGG